MSQLKERLFQDLSDAVVEMDEEKAVGKAGPGWGRHYFSRLRVEYLNTSGKHPGDDKSGKGDLES